MNTQTDNLRDTLRRPARRESMSIMEFRDWLIGLDDEFPPTLHVNGKNHPQSVVTVDFGQPPRPPKITPEQSQELVNRMRRLTNEIMGREMNVRVSFDHQNGIYWAGI